MSGTAGIPRLQAGEDVKDLIYERLTGDGVSEAAERQREALSEMERLMRTPPRLYGRDIC